MSAERLTALANTYDAVRLLDTTDGRVVIVGEHHESTASRRLVQRVLDTTSPELVAIESSPMQQTLFDDHPTNISTGADAAIDYAKQTGAKIGLIDKSQLDFLTDITATEPEPSPCDPPDPNPNGDIPRTAIQRYRGRIQTEAPRRYDLFLLEREQYMAGFVRTLAQTIDGPIVTVVGAGHLLAIADALETGDVRPRDIPDSRIREA